MWFCKKLSLRNVDLIEEVVELVNWIIEGAIYRHGEQQCVSLWCILMKPDRGSTHSLGSLMSQVGSARWNVYFGTVPMHFWFSGVHGPPTPVMVTQLSALCCATWLHGPGTRFAGRRGVVCLLVVGQGVEAQVGAGAGKEVAHN